MKIARRLQWGLLALPMLLASSCVPPEGPGLELALPPEEPQLAMLPMMPEQRLSLDGKLILAAEALSAPAFVRPEGDLGRARECLAAAIYHEARSESEDGQRAVAQVVLNRVRRVEFPSTICGVVYQGSLRSTGCQFSFSCDGSRYDRHESQAWARARRIADEALAGHVFGPVGLATHYHTRQVDPYWARGLIKIAEVGDHLFYRWPGKAGGLDGFVRRSSAKEMAAAAPRQARTTPALETRRTPEPEPALIELAAAEQDAPPQMIAAVQ